MLKVIFGRSNTLSSWAIRTFTWSRWSHCGVILDNKVYEATVKNGVSVSTLDDFKARYTETIIVELPCEDGWEERLNSQLGTKYDWLAVINFVFRRNWKDDKKWFCSEYVAYVLGLFNDKYISRVSPQHILMVAK